MEELAVIKSEIEERKKLNEKIISDTDSFIAASEMRNQDRKALLERAAVSSASAIDNTQMSSDSNSHEAGELSIDGYTLMEVV